MLTNDSLLVRRIHVLTYLPVGTVYNFRSYFGERGLDMCNWKMKLLINSCVRSMRLLRDLFEFKHGHRYM
jgi:hypothetical protein